jgi:hypothetical protein
MPVDAALHIKEVVRNSAVSDLVPTYVREEP